MEATKTLPNTRCDICGEKITSDVMITVVAGKVYPPRNIHVCKDCVWKMSFTLENYRMDRMFEDDEWINGE